MADELATIRAAIQSGDKKSARRMLKPLLDAVPSAELWFMAASACESSNQEVGCLKRALKLDSKYAPARARYRELKQQGDSSDLDMPSLDMLVVDDLPFLEHLTEIPEPVRNRSGIDLQAIKAEKRRQNRRQWNLLGCGGSLLLSLSISYFALSVIGSPIAAQMRRIISGEAPVVPRVGTPVFGKTGASGSAPNSSNNPSTTTGTGSNSGAANPAIVIPTSPDGNPNTYADDAAAAGFVVQPNKSATLTRGSPLSDVLDAGFAHEYTFSASTGEEIAIAIQFFSPTAKSVAKNVAILDSDNVNAESHCERDQIFVDGSGTAFICTIHKGGTWKLQVLGRDGESTGAYVITYDRA
ncbi:MAG: hypothetical protein ABI690_10520 [Chloroflexota bacterium]